MTLAPEVQFYEERKRAKQFTGVEPVRTALFCDDWVGFGIARLYESLMGKHADRGASISRSREGGRLAQRSRSRFNAEG